MSPKRAVCLAVLFACGCATIRRAQQEPTCAGGNGPGSCSPRGYTLSASCEALAARKGLAAPSGRSAGFVVLSDSGYSIRSDGKGPYRNGSANVRVLAAAGAVLFLHGTSGDAVRSFAVDLNHPVPGDIGRKRGRVKADGWPGALVPAGANYQLELGALYLSADTTIWGVTRIPVGATVPASNIGLSFYLNGLLHVLQVGPIPWDFCSADGTTVHGDGTTPGTITRTSPTTWVVDLPPGSIGRLFDVHRAPSNAVNKGLYFVSFHYVVEQKQ